jgi:hypothetical protein
VKAGLAGRSEQEMVGCRPNPRPGLEPGRGLLSYTSFLVVALVFAVRADRWEMRAAQVTR